MRLVGIALIAAAAALLATAGAAVAQPRACTVAYVLDGDTFNCESGTTVRLILIDAPEGGSFGDASRRALATLLPVGSSVRLETDEEVVDGDGRLQAYVFLPNDQMANEVLLRLGYAFFEPAPPNRRYASRLRLAEERARELKLGVWAR